MPIVKISVPSAGAGWTSFPHERGTGRTDAITFGSIRRIATSRAGSAIEHRRCHLERRGELHLYAVALETTLWLVTMSPFGVDYEP